MIVFYRELIVSTLLVYESYLEGELNTRFFMMKDKKLKSQISTQVNILRCIYILALK